MVSIVPQATSSASMPDLKDKSTGLDMSSVMRLDFGSALATGKHSDFHIQCKTYTFHIHQAILCSASPFFKAAMEGNTKEKNKNTIVMPDDEPAVIARLLIFIYTGVYLKQALSEWTYDGITPFTVVQDPYDKATTRWNVASKLAVAMYQIADKVFIEPLKWTCRNTFLVDIRPRPDPDDAHEDSTFWKVKEMQKITEIVKLVYNTTRADDWMLHDPIVHKILIGMQSHGCVRWEYHQPLMEDVPRLAFEIATSQLGNRRNAPKCGKCGKKSPQRLWRCKCGQMEDCEEKECVELRQVRSICDNCVMFGTCTMK